MRTKERSRAYDLLDLHQLIESPWTKDGLVESVLVVDGGDDEFDVVLKELQYLEQRLL
mgnify:CR=1 FL=1